jgi:hypothetical protein
MSSKLTTSMIMPAVVGLIVLVYWPLHMAGFVWDDKIFFHDNAWLRPGVDLNVLVFHGLADWSNYFRPLSMALFIVEGRTFSFAPEPMHFVSLALHICNTLAVGALAKRLYPSPDTTARPHWHAYVAMLFYGLHPALIEPVAWIASQIDLLVILFMLMGLLANLTLRRPAVRALVVASSFFLAACTKEAAIAFPLVLVLLDWGQSDNGPGASNHVGSIYQLWRRQWLVYLAVMAAGVGYLVLRHWSLGLFVQGGPHPVFASWERFQTVSFTYLAYWRILVWPMIGLAPVHIVPAAQFAAVSVASLAVDFAALGLGLTGLLLAWRRHPLGILITCVTAAVLPVLHIIPVAFDQSLFHERYLMLAIALASALLPSVFARIATRVGPFRPMAFLTKSLIGIWLLLAVLNIRITVPLWFNDTSLWQWAARQNPESIFVEDHLLSTYLDSGDLARASGVADFLSSKAQSCPLCMLNVAYLALLEGDAARAASALEKAKTALTHVVSPPSLIFQFIVSTGNLRQLEHDDAAAEEAYRDAISLDPMNPDGYMCLALLLARQKRVDEGYPILNKALSLSAPDTFDKRRSEFERALAQGSTPPPSR